jgi:hypothetical protein
VPGDSDRRVELPRNTPGANLPLDGGCTFEPWVGLSGLLSRGYEVCCGYDADAAGDEHTSAMREPYPSMTRLRPLLHDWNDVLGNAR